VTVFVALTLGPALITVVTRFGKILEPRRAMRIRGWRKIGAGIVRWPGPVLLDIYGSGSWHSGSNSVGGLLDQNSYELGVGVGRIWSLGSFHPRLSAGFARAVLKERIRPDFDDYIERHFETWGSRGWIAVGGFWDTNIGPTLGLAARFSEIGHHDYPQLGGTHVAATLGWRWGLKRR